MISTKEKGMVCGFRSQGEARSLAFLPVFCCEPKRAKRQAAHRRAAR